MVHRVTGLLYLIQYAVVIFLYLFNYPMFLRSPLIITLPLTGVFQTVVAIFTFTFLPKRNADSGYFSDKGTLTYPFVKENLFFAAILCFQWFYYNDNLYPFIKYAYPLEYLFVFLPYNFRFLTAKTRIRDALSNIPNRSTEQNQTFYFYMTWLTKLFYIWAKHYIGFFLNYLRFQNKATPDHQYGVFLLLIAACFATTIAMFLHTLRFRKYLPPRVSFLTYVVAYLSTFIGYAMVFPVFLQHATLFWITLIGLVINLISLRGFCMYQIGVMLAFHFSLVV